jgi:hypothetical protein
MRFPSREWFQAVAVALEKDPAAQGAAADFGPVTAGMVLTKGAGLESDFCVLARIEPGKPAVLRFPEDEDELEELEPDYIAWVPYALMKSAARSQKIDPLKLILSGQIKLKGDLQRVVKHAGKHQGAGAATIRAVPTEFV